MSHSVPLIKIFRILDNQTLSRRSNLILSLLFNDKILTEGYRNSSSSICTFMKCETQTSFWVNSGFEIPKEYLEFPKLYTIYQRVKDGYRNYYQFDPFCRSVNFPYSKSDEETIKNNLSEVEFYEMWTNESGDTHRNDNPAVINQKNGEIVSTHFYINGIEQDVKGKPAHVRRSLMEVKEIYNLLKDQTNINKIDKNLNDLVAFKRHIIPGKHRGYSSKPRSVYIKERQIIFCFSFDNTDDITFEITDNQDIPMRIGIKQVLEMIEDFGNPDLEGNDMSDRFILDYLTV